MDTFFLSDVVKSLQKILARDGDAQFLLNEYSESDFIVNVVNVRQEKIKIAVKVSKKEVEPTE